MIDATAQQPVRVWVGTDGKWPLIEVPATQLDDVKAALDANGVSYWTDDEVLSIDGKPEVAFINLAYGTDAAMVQRVLDAVP